MNLVKSLNSSGDSTSNVLNKNCGSDIMALTLKLHFLKLHLKGNKPDVSAARSLLQIVARRKKLLSYLKSRNQQAYKIIINKINSFGI